MPPKAALDVVHTLDAARLVERARIIMEKPFGTDLASAKALNAELHEVFAEEQIFRIDHFLGKEAALNILAFRFANGLFEPIWNRNFIDHVQIDVPETLSLTGRSGFYEGTGAFKDMVVTHLFQVLAFMAMEPPTSLDSDSISEEKNKVFRSMLPLDPHAVVRGQYQGYRDEDGVANDSETDTFVALKAEIDNWRWAGVPFYLRTGKMLAEGARIISIAFREPPKSMFPAGSGVGLAGPDHLTFDLADSSKMSLSFYGKRPGPGMRLDKLSMQFAMQETERAGRGAGGVRAADLRRDARRAHTVHDRRRHRAAVGAVRAAAATTCRRCGRTSRAPGAPTRSTSSSRRRAWRLPFERSWRKPNRTPSRATWRRARCAWPAAPGWCGRAGAATAGGSGRGCRSRSGPGRSGRGRRRAGEAERGQRAPHDGSDRT